MTRIGLMNKRAVLLANLGSPDRPDIPAVRRYLNQFLMDPYVIQLPWLLRRLIVGLFVLPFRPKRSAHAYQSIWTDRGSPLISLSEDLLAAVQQHTPFPNPSLAVEVPFLHGFDLDGPQDLLLAEALLSSGALKPVVS